MKLKQTFGELMELLKPMSWKERLEYLWEYYKWVLAVAAAAIMLISIICTSIYNKNLEVLFGGAVVNIYLTDETEEYLQQDIEEMLQIGKMERVFVNSVTVGDMSTNTDASTNAMTVIVRIAAKELDYVIMDESALSYYVKTAAVSDLTQCLSEEQLAMFEGKIALAQFEEDGPIVPVALEITDIDFLKDCYTGGRKIYLSFPNNTEHAMSPSQFLDYLLAWEHEEA